MTSSSTPTPSWPSRLSGPYLPSSARWSADMGVWHVSSRVAIMGLLGLAALDVVLVGTALRSTHTRGIDTSSVSWALHSIASTSAPVSPLSTTSVTAFKAPLQTMLVAVDNQRAWRVGAGSCSSGGATLATTVDGGRTWVEVKAHLRRICL